MGVILHDLMTDPDWILQRFMYTLLIVAGSYLILRWYCNVIVRLMNFFGRKRAVSRGHSVMFRRITSWFIWLIVWVVILRVWGVDVTAIWTTFVSLLAVIGVGMLAVWAMVSNITARFFIWFWQPLQLGQRVEIFPESLCGEVIEENLMFTELRQDDGQIVVIPNNLFFQRIIRRLPDLESKVSLNNDKAEPGG